jgi:hypothetical protein
MILPGGTVLPFWSKVRQNSPRGVEFVGRNEWMEWTMLLAPDVATKGVGIELKINPRKRVVEAVLELLPFQTLASMHDESGALRLSLPKEALNVMWRGTSPGLELEAVMSAASGLIRLRSEPITHTPSLLRASAQAMPAAKPIAPA